MNGLLDDLNLKVAYKLGHRYDAYISNVLVAIM